MVVDVHERWLPAPPEAVGQLLETLGGPDDRLWPAARWPAMRLDRPLGLGAQGGHGPIRYRVETYHAGSIVRFTFERPAGFDGHHEYVVVPTSSGTLLRHSLVMHTHGAARVSWPLLYRPLHDALMEDCLDQAATSLRAHLPQPRRWTRHVRALRAIARMAGWYVRARSGAAAGSSGRRRRGFGGS